MNLIVHASFVMAANVTSVTHTHSCHHVRHPRNSSHFCECVNSSVQSVKEPVSYVYVCVCVRLCLVHFVYCSECLVYISIYCLVSHVASRMKYCLLDSVQHLVNLILSGMCLCGFGIVVGYKVTESPNKHLCFWLSNGNINL